MKAAWAFGLALVALACQAPHPEALLGTWRSDEQLTLRELPAERLTETQLEIFSEPGFFGRLEVRFEVGKAYSAFEGSAAWMPYRVVKVGPGFVQIEYMDPLTGDMTEPTLLIEGDVMRMPVRDLGFYELFRRVESPAECLD